MALVSRTTMTATVDEAIHVEVYSIDDDGGTTLLVPADNPVEWSDLSDTTDVAEDDTGYNFISSAVGFDVVTATMGQATADFTLRWTPKRLKFTAEAIPAPAPES